MTSGWAVAALTGTGLAAATVRLRTQAALWVLTLSGSAVAYGGLQSPSVARPLTLLGARRLVAAVVVTLLQADDAVAKPRDRF